MSELQSENVDSVNEIFDEVTNNLTATDNIAYLVTIKRKTLQSVCKQLKRFDDGPNGLLLRKKKKKKEGIL